MIGRKARRIISIVGTRPEAIKIAPLALAAARRSALDHQIIATGQHDALFDQGLADFGLGVHRRLGLRAPGQSIDALAGLIEHATTQLIDELRPALVLVQGDTTTAWAAARGAHTAGAPVGHVEAGLRSHNPRLPWPEERNRVEIDAISTLLFAPSAAARANLAAEGLIDGVHVTGNTGIDALLTMQRRLPPALRQPGLRPILVTCHRRENIGAGVAGVCEALRRIARRPDVRITLPLHANPEIRAGVATALAGVDNIALVPAFGYAHMVAAIAAAHLILSDSGGLQEEAPALGVPLLVLRDNSERPEALATGRTALIGTDPDRIVAAVDRLLDDPRAYAAMARPAFPYGKGDAAERIWDAVEAWLSRPPISA